MSHWPDPVALPVRPDPVGTLHVREDAEYSMYLCRDHQQHERLQTWVVTYVSGRRIVVLAATIEDAASQCKCGDNDEAVACCERLPLRIRGYGRNEL